jgi:hypothetical protein
MQIEISTDSNIEGREELATHVKGVVESTLNRFSDRITRVEVHLSDVNSYKGWRGRYTLRYGGPTRGAPAHRRHAPGNDLGPSGRRRGR